MRRFRQRIGHAAHIPQTDAINSTISMDKSMHVAATPFKNRQAIGGGINTSGQFGNSMTHSALSTVSILPHGNWTSIVGRNKAVNALKNDGSLWGWGYSNQGSIGIPNAGNFPSPMMIGNEKNWIKLFGSGSSGTAAGFMATNSKNEVWGWGAFFDNKSGTGTSTVYLSSPTLMTNITNLRITNVSFGLKHAMGTIDPKSGSPKAGSIYVWGNNSYYQLGNNNHTYQQYYNGYWYTNNADYTTPTNHFFLSNLNYSDNLPFKSISAGNQCCLAIDNKGRLWGWGRNSGGELGRGNSSTVSSPQIVSNDSDWVWVSASGRNRANFACKKDGSVWFAGIQYGQSGLGGTGVINSWTKIPGFWSTTVPGYITPNAGFLVDQNGVLNISTSFTTIPTQYGFSSIQPFRFVPLSNKTPLTTFTVDPNSAFWLGN